jgi:hypothetical protein
MGADHMGPWPNPNKNGAYILLVVDTFIRKVWCRQQVNLEAQTTWRAYHDIVESSGRKPRLLWTDSGKSFTGNYFKSRQEAEGTTLIHTFGTAKSAFAEAANRTIGRRVYEKMTENDTEDWGPLLQECVAEYNAAKHSALGMSPDEASALDEDGMVELWHHLNDKWIVGQPKFVTSPFKKGDRVRLSLDSVFKRDGSLSSAHRRDPTTFTQSRQCILRGPSRIRSRTLLGRVQKRVRRGADANAIRHGITNSAARPSRTRRRNRA